jgi:hypothetical protein
VSVPTENINDKTLGQIDSPKNDDIPPGMVLARLPGEPASSYQALCVYQGLAPQSRSLQAAWERLRSQSSRRPGTPSRPRIADRKTACPGCLTASSVKYGWVERAAAFDAEIDAAKLAKNMRRELDPTNHRFDREFARTVQIEKLRGGSGDVSPWMVPNRLPGESDRSFLAFCLYQGLAPQSRSLQAAWKKFRSQSSPPPGAPGRPRIPDRETACPGSWTGWSVKYRWVERAARHSTLKFDAANLDNGCRLPKSDNSLPQESPVFQHILLNKCDLLVELCRAKLNLGISHPQFHLHSNGEPLR